MEFETINYEKDSEGIAVITLNRPRVRNAVNPQMDKEVRQAIRDAREDDRVRVLILTGAGTAFCSGYDVKEQFLAEERETFQQKRRLMMLRDVRNLDSLDSFPFNLDFYKPTIAAVNGPACGEGFAWCLNCDVRIAAPSAKFSYMFVLRGLMQGASGVHILTRLVGFSRAIEMMLSGEWVEAEEALQIGLIRKIVSHDNLIAESRQMAFKFMEGAPLAQQAIKQAAYRSMLDPSTFQDFWSRLDRALYYTEDHLEGARSFTEKRQPIWKGH